jgi:lipopolysaccharide transport system permease protein
MPVASLRLNWQAGREMLGLLRRHRHLTWEMTRRELTENHAGQMLGALWALLHPALLIGVYLFVFVFVFAVKMGDSPDLPLDYATYLLAGLIPWLTCADALKKTTSVLVNNASLVKQVVFPLEVLPVKTVLASFCTQLVATTLLIVYMVVVQHAFPATLLLLPMLFALQILGLIGLGCILSVVCAYFRDLRELVQILTAIGMYLMPIVYLPSMVPWILQPLLYLNPFSYLVWCYQDACYFGRFAHPWAWAIFPLLSVLIFALGYRAFRKLKPMVGNVL